MENKSNDDRIRTISTANNRITAITDKFAGIVQSFAVNGKNTFLIADVIGVYGFQYADLTTGHILGTARFAGTVWRGQGAPSPHGIGMKPNETEAWVCDRGVGNHFVHVFNIASLPAVQTQLVTVSNDNPHWLTFTIDGRYCYVAGEKGKNERTDIVDTTNYTRVGSLGPSEDLLEVDFNNGQVTAAGSQFGIGRVQR
jgi:DNA-binding beta-propeller fold protein YncE